MFARKNKEKKIAITLCAIAALSVQAAYAKSNELNPKNWQQLGQKQNGLMSKNSVHVFSFKPSSLRSINSEGTIKRGHFMIQAHIPDKNKTCGGFYFTAKPEQLFCAQVLDLTIDCKNKKIDINQAHSFGKNNKYLGSQKTIMRGHMSVVGTSSSHRVYGYGDSSEWGYYYRAACPK